MYNDIGTYEIVGGGIKDDTTNTEVIFTYIVDGEECKIKRLIPHFMADSDEIILLGINNRMISEARALGLVPPSPMPEQTEVEE